MPDFVIRPSADTDFANATFHSGTTPVTATGLTNDTEYEAFVLSAASDPFTPEAVVSSSFATKAAGADAYLTGPVLPSGVNGITAEFDIVLKEGTGGFYELIEYISTTFVLSVDTRAGKGDVRFTMEDSAGTLLFNNDITATAVTLGARQTIVVTGSQDVGGNAVYAVYVDGSSVASGSVAASGTGNFVTNRTLELLRDVVSSEIEIYSAKVWHSYTADGTTAGLGTPVHAVAGAASEWNTPNDTGSAGNLVKVGAASFT